jgi:hypothetical protein
MKMLLQVHYLDNQADSHIRAPEISKTRPAVLGVKRLYLQQGTRDNSDGA